jgi:hypothetical protein
MKKYWLANKNGKKNALMPVTDDNSIHFEIVGQDNKIPDNLIHQKAVLTMQYVIVLHAPHESKAKKPEKYSVREKWGNNGCISSEKS